MHRVGDRVRNRKNGWYGRVLAVECMICGQEFQHGECPAGHGVANYFITVAQDNVPADRRPWCIPDNFPVVEPPVPRPTAWARVLEDPLVQD